MGVVSKEKVKGAAAWRGCELAGDDSWIHPLSDRAIESIDKALAQVKARGLQFPHFSRDDFPLDDLAPILRTYADELEQGRGFLLLRGLPVSRYSDDEINIVYYGIGLHLGAPVRQNPKGDLLGLVMNDDVAFEIDDYVRWRLMEGLDDIGITMTSASGIDEFEGGRPAFKATTTAVA